MDFRENEMVQFTYQYKNIVQTRELIEKGFKRVCQVQQIEGK